MVYNDLFGSFDSKSFELMAKEYSKKNNKNIEILQNNSKNTNEFLDEFENFLRLLMSFYKENNRQNFTFFEDKIQLKNEDLRGIISNFCGLYKEVKNDYFFTPFACKIEGNFDIKNEIKNSAEKLLFLSPNNLQKDGQKMLIKSCFLLVKFL